MASEKPILYSYFRSSCSWRVRIALALKGIEYDYHAVNILKEHSEQLKPEFKKLNPKGEVPVLFIDGHYLFQSLPIIEYLEETKPNTRSLYPKDAYKRAQTRAIAEIVNSGIQPLQNLTVLGRVGEEKKQEWLENFISKGLAAIEEVLKQTSGKYCVGDEVTIADICLVPQVYSANRFKVSLDEFPNVKRVNAELEKLPEFQGAHPSKQPDCPPDLR